MHLTSRLVGRWASWFVAVALLWPLSAAAQGDPTIIPVPFAQNNPNLPHPAHERARITLKAIARNANCGAGYTVWWDTNFDGNYNNDASRDVSPQSGTVYDLGRTFEVPDVQRDTLLPVNVRVRNKCLGANDPNRDTFSSFRVFVYDFTLSGNPTVAANDPGAWTDDRLQIISAMVIQETMWWIHRVIGSRRNFGRADLAGHIGGETTVDGLGLWVFTANGHLPAYPPNTINSNPLPNGWAARNDAIWNADPYAEDVMAMTNYVLAAGTGYNGMNCADDRDANTKGYNANGTEVPFNRIPGTGDCRGMYSGGYGNYTYAQGMLLGGLATTLPTLAGTNLQTGAPGMKWEYFIQEMADWLGYMQVDGGVANGGWEYTAYDGGGGACEMDLSTAQWAYVGLESAEVAGASFGVFVPNRHKYRMADNLINNQRGDGGGAYRTCDGGSNFQLTGGSILSARWMNTHNFAANDGTVAFPQQSGLTRGQLRQSYDRYMQYTANNWTSNNRSGSIGWKDRLWRNGRYTCDNLNAVYNAGRCGNTYAMYSHQKGYRTGTPEVSRIGNIDWFREFSVYYARAQNRDLNDYGNFGQLTDDFCEEHTSVTCSFNAPFMSSAMGALTVTQTVFKPKPVALPIAAPANVVEGCFGGNNGQVRFTHDTSFHPNPSARIVAYRWDVDSRDGLWWDPNAANRVPDFVTGDAGAAFQHTYQRAGVYTATLQVVDNTGEPNAVPPVPPLTNEKTVTITVNSAANEAPAAAHGGPYIVEVGQNLQLRGTASDVNLACGDVLTSTWQLGAGNAFNFANGANAQVAWASLAGQPQGQPIRLALRVRDAAGRESTAETTLTIYSSTPVAAATANPNPAACGQDVVFDGGQSFHPNPQRSISSYQWNVDGQPGYEGGGQRFTHRYNRFGQYSVVLRVTDDLGRTADLAPPLVVNVNQGNVAPVARTSQANYVVLEGENLTLDGTPSTDANLGCGDSIAAYEWDIDGNGNFNENVVGSQPVVPWATLSGLRWPADRATGLPTNTISLRVRDSFGQTSTVNATITIYRGIPAAVIVQNPDPSPVDLANGNSSTTLDGRESSSPVPGVTIARYDWDLNDDGNYEVANSPTVLFNYDFAPGAGARPPANLPAVFVRLRVTDSTGRTATVRTQVRYDIPPTSPTADADPSNPPERNYHILLGDGVALDPSQSSDPDTAQFGDFIRFYRWDVNNAGDINAANVAWDFTTEDPNGARANIVQNVTAQQLTTAGVNAPGTFRVLLEVEDITELRSRDTATLNVYNRNPVALATVNPNPAACGARVTLDGARSDHPHPTIDVVAWDWDIDGNGTFGDLSGQIVNQVYNQFSFSGPIRVGLRVRDTNGNTATTTVDLNVNSGNRDPVANAGGPYAIVVGDNLTLNGAGSSEPDVACGDALVRYEWDLNADGSYEFNGANPGQAVTWAQLNAAGINAARPLNNPYQVRLRVTDRFGRQTTQTVALNVVPPPTAVATATPDSIACNQQVVFDATSSFSNGPAGDANLAIARYEWDFDGDGVFETQGARVTRNVAALQTPYVARVRVVDAAGHTSATVNVNVRLNLVNVAPVANAGGPYVTGRVGAGFATVTLDGRNSRDPNAPCDAISTYRWDTDNDGLFGTEDNGVVGGPNGGLDDFEGATVAGYSNVAWQIGQDFLVNLVVCDSGNPRLCSQPAQATIRVQLEAPPVGEIRSPRSDDPTVCIGAAPFDVAYSVADPEGDPVTVIVLAGGVEVARQNNVATNANGTPVNGTIRIANPALVPEGGVALEVRFDDNQGGVVTVNAGGPITFDRTAPAVSFGNMLISENICLPANQAANVDLQPRVQDAGDPSPRVEQSRVELGCRDTYTVTATDKCGNVGSAVRNVRVAEPVEVTVNGATEGQLVQSTRLTWMVVGPADCVNSIMATLAHNGGAANNYVANSVVDLPGTYTLDLTITNCSGTPRHQLLNFAVNRSPVPDAQIAGHPNVDPAGPVGRPSYIVDEGSGLQLDASESSAPEAIDRIVRYEWDFTNDGTFDFTSNAPMGGSASPLATFPTDANGVFTGTLRATDSLGSSADQLFQVTVRDITPIASAAGPYVVPQGVALTLDGAASRSLSPADAITRYTWDFNDGTPNGVVVAPAANSVTHTWLNDGLYNVRLTVQDEDNNASVVTTVTVRDVDPIINAVTPPDPAYEIADMRFSIDATQGAPGDPITRIEWDFTGDGQPDRAGESTTWIFEDAGNYPVTVTVYDRDSSTTQRINLRVREITFAELMQVADARIAAVRNDPNASLVAKGRVLNTQATIEDGGLWAERYGRRGDSWVAWDSITFDVKRSQEAGGDYGNLLWAISRTLLRDLTALRTSVVTGEQNRAPVPADHPSVVRADSYLADLRAIYDDPNFRRDVSGAAGAQLVRDLFGAGYEAYFYLRDAIDPCNRFDKFAVPEPVGANADPVRRVANANAVNTNLITALGELRTELQTYVDSGAPGDLGPGHAQVLETLGTLGRIQDLVRLPIAIVCDAGQCITDEQALQNELLLMDLIDDLYEAAGEGVYIRNIQACLMLAVKFRIEISLLRVEFVCGQFSAVARNARTSQRAGLALVDNTQVDAALQYYTNDEQRCLIVRTYNTCFVAREGVAPQPWPAVCPEAEPAP